MAVETEKEIEETLASVLAIALALRTMPFEVNLWQAQNIWNDLLRRGDKQSYSTECRLNFKKLGEALYICVDQLTLDYDTPAN